jgi:2-polyprenyl-3-methyl-5-hydroxy-6-metoxy-1,4-benzoquinol methylase
MPKILYNRHKFIASLVKNKEVLDLGCVGSVVELGDSHLWLHRIMCESARKVTGLDGNSEGVVRMKELGYDARLGDFTDFDLKSMYDVVVAGEILEHSSNPAGILASIHRHLRPEGLLVVSVPNILSIVYVLENFLFGHEIDNPEHICCYTETTLVRTLRKAGYEIDAVHYIAQYSGYLTKNKFLKVLFMTKHIIQVLAGYIRPSYCQNILVLAHPEREAQ